MPGLKHEERLDDREEHPEKYCTHVREDGTPCLRYRNKGRELCTAHGGKAGRPVTTGEQTQTARDLWAVPEEVREGVSRKTVEPPPTDRQFV